MINKNDLEKINEHSQFVKTANEYLFKDALAQDQDCNHRTSFELSEDWHFGSNAEFRGKMKDHFYICLENLNNSMRKYAEIEIKNATKKLLDLGYEYKIVDK